MTRHREQQPTTVPKTATVPFAATPAGEPPSVRDWANPGVWTDRMLTTLESGVRGGKWHTLYDKVFSRRTLFAASQSVIVTVTGEHLPESAGSPAGRCGIRTGSLRRRFCDSLSDSRGSRASVEVGAVVGRGKRPDAASGKDQDRRCSHRRI